MNYKVISKNSPAALNDAVNEHLAQGWQLSGSVAVSTTGNSSIYAQAMTKESGDQPAEEV